MMVDKTILTEPPARYDSVSVVFSQFFGGALIRIEVNLALV